MAQPSKILRRYSRIQELRRVKSVSPEALSLQELLAAKGDGCMIRGWRKELDPDGALEVNFPTFCASAKRMGYVGDSYVLFGLDQNHSSLTLTELHPQTGHLLDRFKLWVKDTFGSPQQMFSVFDTDALGHLDRDTFVYACREHGFVADGRDLNMVYSSCDYGDVGTIIAEDVVFLEVDTKARENEQFKLKLRQMHEWKQQISKDYLHQVKSCSHSECPNVHARHRLAPRPWQAHTFEALPSVVCHLRNEEHRNALRQAKAAEALFLQHIRRLFGNEVRAFRHALDKDDSFSVSLNELRRYLRSIDLDVNISSLWRGLKKDDNPEITLEELCVQPAMALARFRHWAQGRFGSCAALWTVPEALALRKKKAGTAWISEKKMLHAAILETLHSYNWQEVASTEQQNLVLSSLDLYGCGLIMKSDLEWLDQWQAPDWLAAEADHDAWHQLKDLLAEKYRHPLRAWRSLDKDSSNKISWSEFVEVCDGLDFTGNIGGAWRAVDSNLNGFISMKDFDQPSFELLHSFKEWAHLHFGSIQRCFKALDAEQTGCVTYHELKRSCFKMKWIGDFHSLFECLTMGTRKENKRSITLDEVSFLDKWHFEPVSEVLDNYDSSDLALSQTADFSGSAASKPRDSRPRSRTTSLQQPRTPSLSFPTLVDPRPQSCGSPSSSFSCGLQPHRAQTALDRKLLLDSLCMSAWESEIVRPGRGSRLGAVPTQSPYYCRKLAKAQQRQRRSRSTMARYASAPQLSRQGLSGTI